MFGTLSVMGLPLSTNERTETGWVTVKLVFTSLIAMLWESVIGSPVWLLIVAEELNDELPVSCSPVTLGKVVAVRPVPLTTNRFPEGELEVIVAVSLAAWNVRFSVPTPLMLAVTD